jgi:hypothetical protein
MWLLLDVQTIGVLVTATSVTIAAIYYVMTLRASQRNMKTNLETRQAQLFMPIYSTYYSDEFMRARSEILKWNYENYDDYVAKYGYEANPEANTMHRKVNGYFEGIGVLVSHGLIDSSLVDDLMSGAIVTYWEKFRSYILEYRRRIDWPQAGEQIEYLYKQIKPIVERQRRELTSTQ